MVEYGVPIVALMMLLAAISRLRREMYLTGMLFIVGGLMLLIQAQNGASQFVMNGSSLGWLNPALCVTKHHC